MSARSSSGPMKVAPPTTSSVPGSSAKPVNSTSGVSTSKPSRRAHRLPSRPTPRSRSSRRSGCRRARRRWPGTRRDARRSARCRRRTPAAARRSRRSDASGELGGELGLGPWVPQAASSEASDGGQEPATSVHLPTDTPRRRATVQAIRPRDGPCGRPGCIIAVAASGSSSAGRAQPSQGWGRGFDPRLPLHLLAPRDPVSSLA